MTGFNELDVEHNKKLKIDKTLSAAICKSPILESFELILDLFRNGQISTEGWCWIVVHDVKELESWDPDKKLLNVDLPIKKILQMISVAWLN